MTQIHSTSPDPAKLSKVPEVTLYFWIIKILCTTVGETAADFLNINLNLGLTGTSVITGIVLLIALVVQLKSQRYVPSTYWVAVMLISIFGTLVTDNLTDKLGIPLEISTIVFSVLLMACFFIWYRFERTLSIHSIYTARRELFYWFAVLFTFALGTASGDLMAEGLGLGYAVTGVIIAILIAIFIIAWKLKLNPVLSFWLIYILTRPLGASIGDYLSQSSGHGGLGLGTTDTTVLFVSAILTIVAYLSVTKRDVIGKEFVQAVRADEQRGGLLQTAAVAAFLVIVGVNGYQFRQMAIQAEQPFSPNGLTQSNAVSWDLSQFKTITKDTFELLTAGKQYAATQRISDLEYEWDKAEARLKPRNNSKWTEIDYKIDAALRELRSISPTIEAEKSALKELLNALQ